MNDLDSGADFQLFRSSIQFFGDSSKDDYSNSYQPQTHVPQLS